MTQRADFLALKQLVFLMVLLKSQSRFASRPYARLSQISDLVKATVKLLRSKRLKKWEINRHGENVGVLAKSLAVAGWFRLVICLKAEFSFLSHQTAYRCDRIRISPNRIISVFKS